MITRPVWAEINLSAIRHNIREIKSLLRTTTKFCAVVKADGYGHGAIPVARAALQEGADYLAVALMNEALELRQAGITVPILILGYTPPEQARLTVAYDITQTVYTPAMVRALSQAATAEGKKAKVHIKVDTGMGRIGVKPEEAVDLAVFINSCPGIELEGIFSHFAAADSRDKTYTRRQFAQFEQVLADMDKKGMVIPIRHIANSAAILDLPDMQLDMVRAGIILYGLLPSEEVQPVITLEPAMQFKARISHIKKVASGVAISYGCTYVTERPGVIATLPVGYADGWTRLMAGKASVFLHRKRAPLVGRVCMDQCMIDVTDIPETAPGDEVLLFGGPDLPVEEVAAHMGTINYEVVCMVSKRVPRQYKK
ncbi:Alanine racemase [Propionispora sp. 2/2-37]|uniref:alanine racemase n=1 Tax=Propionispora sp. 2/2-37 TaxID=1677858 RepID=UPI0006BB742F|nr:alanine racemase [Propionispora sp. 2/2-37]CUH97575.1 Alanine racemase [Propionispora sp. 2/2-37]